MGVWHFKLLALLRQCSSTSVKESYSCIPLFWHLFMDWMLSLICLQVTGCWLLTLGLLIRRVTQDKPKTQIWVTFLFYPGATTARFSACLTPCPSLTFLSPCPSNCKMLRNAPQVPIHQPKHFVPVVRAKEGSSLGSMWLLFCEYFPRGWGFSHLAGFLSLCPMWVLHFQQNRPQQKGPSSPQHTSEVFIRYEACNLERMDFGCLFVFHRSRIRVSPAWTLALISPQGCCLSFCPAHGAGIFPL